VQGSAPSRVLTKGISNSSTVSGLHWRVGRLNEKSRKFQNISYRYIRSVVYGLAVQAAAGATTKELRKVADLALQAWPQNKKRGRAA
jgi:hypothetical protein